MSRSIGTQNRKNFQMPFHSIRNISCPEDLENRRKIYCGHAPIRAIVELPTDENVRDYLLEAEGKKRRRPTQVNKAIQDTLENCPSNFSVLNSGVVIVARSCEIDEQKKVMRLAGPSIINGSQTQGVIQDYLQKFDGEGSNFGSDVHIKFEIIVVDDDDLVGEISIARNFQNDVMTISIAGRLGQLDELEKSFQDQRPGSLLKKSETKLSDDYIKTERLLQVIAALVPAELWVKTGEMNKVYTYSMKAKCLKEFQEIYKKADNKNKSDPEHAKYKDLYQFYLDICAEADDVYDKWKSHQGFLGARLRSIERSGSGRTIEEVPEGIVFPILASLSVFAKRTSKGWRIVPPSRFKDEELISAAVSVYKEIAHHNPNTMGKSKACYDALYRITSIYERLASPN